MESTPFKIFRKKRGYSQDEMAKLIGCTVATIRKLDSGEVGHNAYWLRKRAIEILQTSDVVLFG